MVKYNSKAILEIDVYAITLRNHQIYFHSFIISPFFHFLFSYTPDQEKILMPLIQILYLSLITTSVIGNTTSEKLFIKSRLFLQKWELKMFLLQIRKEHKYPSRTTTNERHKCFNKILHAK